MAAVDMAVLIVSCDKYSDAWGYFFHCWRRFWPDCPWPLYLGSNFKRSDEPGVVSLLVGEDRDWSSNCIQMLERVEATRICLLLDDYFLEAPVSTTRARYLADVHLTSNAATMLLSDRIRPDRFRRDVKGVGYRDPGAPYRASLNAAYWDVAVLKSLLRHGESPWEFEIQGSRRTDAISRPFLVAWPRLFALDPDGIARGKWAPTTVAKARRLSYKIDTDRREVLSSADVWRRRFGKPKRMLVRAIPWKVRFKIGDLSFRLGIRKPRKTERVVW